LSILRLIGGNQEETFGGRCERNLRIRLNTTPPALNCKTVWAYLSHLRRPCDVANKETCMAGSLRVHCATLTAFQYSIRQQTVVS